MGQGPECLSVQQVPEGPGGPGEAQDIRASAWMRGVNEIPATQTARGSSGEVGILGVPCLGSPWMQRQ